MFPAASARQNQLVFDFQWDGSQKLESMVSAANDPFLYPSINQQILFKKNINSKISDDGLKLSRSGHSVSSNSSWNSSSQSTQNIRWPEAFRTGGNLQGTRSSITHNSVQHQYRSKQSQLSKANSDPMIPLTHDFHQTTFEVLNRERSMSSDDIRDIVGSRDLDFEAFFATMDPGTKPPTWEQTPQELEHMKLDIEILENMKTNTNNMVFESPIRSELSELFSIDNMFTFSGNK